MLICGVEDRRDGLYLMNTGSNFESWTATHENVIREIGAEEVQCSSILEYLNLQGDLREVHVGQKEL